MALLELAGVSKRFGGLTALDGVDMAIETGEIHALVGPNGAGKTTLINLLTRVYEPSAGRLSFGGVDLFRLRPHQVIGAGMARIFQHMELFKEMSVLENVLVGCHAAGKVNIIQAALGIGRAFSEHSEQVERAMAALAFVGLADQADREAGTLTGGNGRMLGLARAIVSRPRLLLLDELVAGLNSRERERAGELVLRLRSEQGMTVLAIEHDMNFILDIADRITVLDFGQKIADGAPEEVLANPAVVKAYLGSGRYGHA
jgi:ABC-type branched-subunit amino acid transport system ATPase component